MLSQVGIGVDVGKDVWWDNPPGDLTGGDNAHTVGFGFCNAFGVTGQLVVVDDRANQYPVSCRVAVGNPCGGLREILHELVIDGSLDDDAVDRHANLSGV